MLQGYENRRPHRLHNSDHVIRWIERFCLIPDGPHSGKWVKLSTAEKETVRQPYDGDAPIAQPITGHLAAYLSLLHLCGPMAGGRAQPPLVETTRQRQAADCVRYCIGTIAAASSAEPEVAEALDREGALAAAGGFVLMPEPKGAVPAAYSERGHPGLPKGCARFRRARMAATWM